MFCGQSDLYLYKQIGQFIVYIKLVWTLHLAVFEALKLDLIYILSPILNRWFHISLSILWKWVYLKLIKVGIILNQPICKPNGPCHPFSWDEPICHLRGVWYPYSFLIHFWYKFMLAKTPHSTASDLSLHCLHTICKRDTRHKRINKIN